MAPTKPSDDSDSSANTITFREQTLYRAGIEFKRKLHDAPSHVGAFAVVLNTVSDGFYACRTITDYRTAADQGTSDCVEVEAARRLSSPSDDDIADCSGEDKRLWMRDANERMFQPFVDHVKEGSLSRSEAAEWDAAQELSPPSETSLRNSKPDIAFGLGVGRNRPPPSQRAQSLNFRTLADLQESPAIRLEYSPQLRKKITFPAVIYEAQSDCEPLLWAENRAAVGATRALGILRDLARLSDDTHPSPMVVLVASAGSAWRFHVATSVEWGDRWGVVSGAAEDEPPKGFALTFSCLTDTLRTEEHLSCHPNVGRRQRRRSLPSSPYSASHPALDADRTLLLGKRETFDSPKQLPCYAKHNHCLMALHSVQAMSDRHCVALRASLKGFVLVFSCFPSAVVVPPGPFSHLLGSDFILFLLRCPQS